MSDKIPYFPMFVNLSGAKGYIIGGDKQAYQKVMRMKPYGCQLTIISEKIVPELEQMEKLCIIKRHFQKEDFEIEPDFVIVSEADEEEKQWIYDFCQERRIPVNAVDDISHCTYIYPALIAKGDLSIGISTGGASPFVTSILKEEIMEFIPSQIEEILVYLEGLRPKMKEQFPSGKERGKILKEIAAACLLKNRILTKAEEREILEKYEA